MDLEVLVVVLVVKTLVLQQTQVVVALETLAMEDLVLSLYGSIDNDKYKKFCRN
jgi:hypothetical protein